jgi:hypothetical protein
MDRKNIIGIDCGVGGGIAFSNSNGTVHAINMPDTSTAHGLEKLRSKLFFFAKGPCIAYVEDVPPFVGTNRPAARIFKLAKNYGEVLGLLTGLHIDYEKVRPAAWMKAIGAGKKKDHASDNKWKNHLKEIAQSFYPSKKPTLKTADALLILQYGTALELARGDLRTLGRHHRTRIGL